MCTSFEFYDLLIQSTKVTKCTEIVKSTLVWHLGLYDSEGKSRTATSFRAWYLIQHVWILVDNFYEDQTGVSTLPSAVGLTVRWVTVPSSTHFPLVWATGGRLESGGQLGSARSSSSIWACLGKLLLRQERQETIWFNQVFSAKKFYKHTKKNLNEAKLKNNDYLLLAISKSWQKWRMFVLQLHL